MTTTEPEAGKDALLKLVERTMVETAELYRSLDSRLDVVEKMVESVEEQVAILITAYGEVSAISEATITAVNVAENLEELKTKFGEVLKSARKTYMDVLRGVSEIAVEEAHK